MAKMVWDQMAEKFFEGGCSKGVCYTDYDTTNKIYSVGEAWNGVSGFTDNPSGADEQASYADNIKYISMRGAENYGGTIKCFWYPENFRKCLGKKSPVASSGGASIKGITVSQQARESFGFVVTTQVGNDVDGIDKGETLHIVWNATTSPSSKDYSSMNESPSPSELSFEFTANPIAVGDGTIFKPTCNMEICTVGMGTDELTAYENLKTILYGGDSTFNVLTSEPSDWSTNYTSYYTRTGAGTAQDPYVYEHVAVGTGAPTFVSSTYYKEDPNNAYLPSPEYIISTIFGGLVNTVAEG